MAEGTKLGYRPELDGLRAVAVAAVMAAHLLPGSVTAGGSFGVDVFFVLSGYLITRLMIVEHRDRGGIDRGAFLWRRFARLMPAFVALLAFVGAWTVVTGSSVVHLQAVAPAAAYVSNWWTVTGGQLGALEHTWSLAVEEQFYLAWALLAPVVIARRHPARILFAAVVLFAVWRAWSMARGTEGVYWRSDMRADEPLAGCGLAFVAWQPRRWMAGAAWAVLAWVVVFTPLAFWLAVPVVIVATGVLVLQGGGRWLAASPMRWIGARSYSIYLWHYPLYVFATERLEVSGWSSLVLVPLTLVVADVSYRSVERPARAALLARRSVVVRVGAADRRDQPAGLRLGLPGQVGGADFRTNLDVVGGCDVGAQRVHRNRVPVVVGGTRT